MQSPTAKEATDPRSLWQRLRGARETEPEAELFGPRGKLPPRGEPDTDRDTALRWLVGIIVVGLVLRLAVPRGLWLDEAISVYQAHLGLGDMFENIFYGDRHPPLHHIVLWLTVRVFGDGELAVRLPSLVAGTLVIPALYWLGRELYDRRTGLIAAAFGAASPLLIWYTQEARMYAFVALFGLLALLTQVRVVRNPNPTNWVLYILATAALLWSHYFGLLLVAVQQVIFVALLVQRRRAGEPSRALAIGFGYSLAVLILQVVPLLVFAEGQYDSTRAAAGSPEGSDEPLSFYAVMANMAWALWGYHSDAITELLAAMWPLFLLFSLLLLGRGGSRQTIALAIAAVSPIVLLFAVAVFARELFEVRYFLIAVPLLFLLAARLVTGWLRNPRGRALVVGGVILTLLVGLVDQQTSDDNPRLFDFRGAIEKIKADAGPKSVVIYEPPDMRYVLEYYAPELSRQPRNRTNAKRVKGSPVFVLASFQDNKAFFDRTNKVIGQLDFYRKRIARFRTPQTLVTEFR
ncbi:MAG TPA: glycosyltransferase family 39 protein [Thermoleophilaceae bacterium]|nr:glycosyltransferase family 39 protein [Thermoleophilaceae bacterium]